MTSNDKNVTWYFIGSRFSRANHIFLIYFFNIFEAKPGLFEFGISSRTEVIIRKVYANLRMFSIERIITLTRSKAIGKEIPDIGRVVIPRLPSSDVDLAIPSHAVPVVVSAIEYCGTGVLKVGQLILWLRKQVDILQKRRPPNKNIEMQGSRSSIATIANSSI